MVNPQTKRSWCNGTSRRQGLTIEVQLKQKNVTAVTSASSRFESGPRTKGENMKDPHEKLTFAVIAVSITGMYGLPLLYYVIYGAKAIWIPIVAFMVCGAFRILRAGISEAC